MNGQPLTGARPSWAARHQRILGGLLLLALHAVLLPFATLIFRLKADAGVLVIGVVQLAYVVPSLIVLMMLGRIEMLKGFLFAALATLVVNAAGCAWAFWSLHRMLPH